MSDPQDHIDDDDREIVLGKFGRAHGLRGEVRLFAFGTEELVAPGLDAFIARADGSRTPTTLKQVRWRERFAIVALDGLRHRDQAEELTHAELVIPRAALPAPDPDELYLVDLIGAPVFVEGGPEGAVGEVADVLDYGAQEILSVSIPGSNRLLVPLVDHAIRRLDVDAVVLAPLSEWAAPELVAPWESPED
jgi:16S rRNA processing protein RimM